MCLCDPQGRLNSSCHCERSEAIHAAKEAGLLRRKRSSQWRKHTSAISRRASPELCWKIPLPSIQRGRRECRMRAAPAVSCAKNSHMAHTSIQVKRRTSDIPCAMALRLIRDLPGEPSSVATVTSQMTSAKAWRQLRAPGPHDFAVRKQARFVTSAAASTASRPAAVTIACRPSVGQDRGSYKADLLSASRTISEIQKLNQG